MQMIFKENKSFIPVCQSSGLQKSILWMETGRNLKIWTFRCYVWVLVFCSLVSSFVSIYLSECALIKFSFWKGRWRTVPFRMHVFKSKTLTPLYYLKKCLIANCREKRKLRSWNEKHVKRHKLYCLPACVAQLDLISVNSQNFIYLSLY